MEKHCQISTYRFVGGAFVTGSCVGLTVPLLVWLSQLSFGRSLLQLAHADIVIPAGLFYGAVAIVVLPIRKMVPRVVQLLTVVLLGEMLHLSTLTYRFGWMYEARMEATVEIPIGIVAFFLFLYFNDIWAAISSWHANRNWPPTIKLD